MTIQQVSEMSITSQKTMATQSKLNNNKKGRGGSFGQKMRKLRLSIGSCGTKLSCAKNTADSPKTPPQSPSARESRNPISDIDIYKQTFNENPPE